MQKSKLGAICPRRNFGTAANQHCRAQKNIFFALKEDMPKEQKHDTFSALFAFRQHERAGHNTARLIGARTALEFNPKKRLNAALSAQKSAR